MSPETREKLTRVRSVLALDQLGAHIRSLSSGDRVLLYVLIALLCIASLVSLYALERSLLVSVPAYGGTLVEGEVGSPRFINPLLAISDADRDLTALAYAGLMGLSGSGTLVPILAEQYQLSPDGKTYTFTLRSDALFSDGAPVTADDVVFTVQKAKDPALKSPRYADWAGVEVVAIDSHTVRFILSRPYAPFLGLTTLGILPVHLWKNVSSEEFPFSTLETAPVGAGPFTVSGVSRDSSGLIKSVSFGANTRYALGRPYLDGIKFVFYARAEDLSAALKNHDIESAYDLGAAGALTAPYARVFGVFWNPGEKQVYAREEVRKALSIAIDRQDIVERVLGGYATPIMGPVPPGGPVTQATIPVSSNPTADAARVLTTAGWTYDSGARLWKNTSAKQTLDRIVLRTSNVAELKSVASAVKADWEKLGIPVTVELYEPGDLSQNVIRPRKYEALLYGEVIGRDQDLFAFWHSRERNDPGLNIALYANKTVDALLEDIRSTSDAKQRLSDLEKVESTVAADYPAVFLYAPDFSYTVPVDLRGVVLPQMIVPADRFASVTGWYRFTDAVWPFFARPAR